MNVAELFVNLGIAGADKTVGALDGVGKMMGELKSSSIETKASILAVMYGLERMAAVSGQTGTELTNFTAITGLSARNLQQWQYAARQAGVASGDFENSLKGVQNNMTNVLLGKGIPEGFNLVKQAAGGLDPTKLRDTFYVMGQLQKAAQNMPQDIGNHVLKSFGLSEETIGAMRRNAFNPAAMSKAPLYSDREIQSLNKSNIAWSNLGNTIQMAFGHFNAKHGQQLVNDITKIVAAVEKLADALVTLSERLKVFQALGKAAEGVATVLALTSVGIDDTTGNHKSAQNNQFGKDSIIKKILDWRDAEDQDFFKSMQPPTSAGAQGNVQNTTINQTITHNGDARDTQAVKASHKTGAAAAYRQRPNYDGN